MYLIILPDIKYVKEKVAITREDLGRAKQRGDLIVDLVNSKKFDPGANAWVPYDEPVGRIMQSALNAVPMLLLVTGVGLLYLAYRLIRFPVKREPYELPMMYSAADLKKWWAAKCSVCGWRGLSRDCVGGGPIADTGDYNDPICPECFQDGDYNVVEDDKNVQEIK